MTTLEILENKIRQSIPELKNELQDSENPYLRNPVYITPIMLNHVLVYFGKFYKKDPLLFVIDCDLYAGRVEDNLIKINPNKLFWDLKYNSLKDQSKELITFLNELK